MAHAGETQASPGVVGGAGAMSSSPSPGSRAAGATRLEKDAEGSRTDGGSSSLAAGRISSPASPGSGLGDGIAWSAPSALVAGTTSACFFRRRSHADERRSHTQQASRATASSAAATPMPAMPPVVSRPPTDAAAVSAYAAAPGEEVAELLLPAPPAATELEDARLGVSVGVPVDDGGAFETTMDAGTTATVLAVTPHACTAADAKNDSPVTSDAVPWERKSRTCGHHEEG